MRVHCEHDVITMRQEVRQMARLLGLGLVEQAKIATAISAVARVLLTLDCTTVFTMRATGQGEHSALEISCVPPFGSEPIDIGQLEQKLNLTSTRLLVDEASLSRDANDLVLILRMRLARQAAHPKHG
jgi:hypothetical protein